MDPAFVWESQSPPPPPRSWVTLETAADITGLPAKTIRNWARKQKIRSRLVDDERVVLRSEVVERARKRAEAEASKQKRKSRQADASKTKKSKVKKKPQVETAKQEKPAAKEPPGPATPSDEGPPPPLDSTVGTQPPTPPVPEGSMLVPIDEWRRLLNQLGNLHEAGQQLADARERAAKAETEAQFLKERVRELRTRLESAEQPAPEPVPKPEPPVEPQVEHHAADPGPFWLYLIRRWGARSR
jgi:chemotaxis protein histidine kinase CheA